jgi:hypothetical protein
VSGAWVAAFVALWLVTLLNTVVVLGGLRRILNVLEHVEARLPAEASASGAAVGSTIAPFDLVDGEGRELAWTELVQERTIFLLMSKHCAACEALAGRLGSRQHVDGVPLVVVMDDAEAGREGLPPGLRVLYERDGAATRALGNRATPQAYVVDRSGIVLGRTVLATLEELRNLAWFQQNGGDRAKALAAKAHE